MGEKSTSKVPVELFHNLDGMTAREKLLFLGILATRTGCLFRRAVLPAHREYRRRLAIKNIQIGDLGNDNDDMIHQIRQGDEMMLSRSREERDTYIRDANLFFTFILREIRKAKEELDKEEPGNKFDFDDLSYRLRHEFEKAILE